MRLYHATDAKNVDSIACCGIQPKYDSYRATAHELECEGIYGFTTIKAALNFGRDQCYDHIAVYSFEADEADLMLDPEYEDASAYLLPTESGIDATLELEI